ncbi:unnamed protein product [Spirodela intermedia]|uniref:Uncharacterized protein n=1 Tax=Spirodela intermedia TaxID=51605 RepID=A0A7I8IJC1_SPIIN|nr:unnamed protein product [Spirodela intermedia]CAA6657065.1 unnamed protein product [Spirodela intermedia]
MAETEDPIAGDLFLKGLVDQGFQPAPSYPTETAPTSLQLPVQIHRLRRSRRPPRIFPTQAPEFVNQTVITRSWELLHLLLVGLAVSYGLFSRRNAFDPAAVEHLDGSKADNAPAFVSDLLQVPRASLTTMQTSFRCGATSATGQNQRSLRSPIDNGGDGRPPPVLRKPRSEKMSSGGEASPPSFSLVSTSRPPPLLPAGLSLDLREKKTYEDSGKRKPIVVEGYSPDKPIRRTARPKEAAAQGPDLLGWSPEPPQHDLLPSQRLPQRRNPRTGRRKRTKKWTRLTRRRTSSSPSSGADQAAEDRFHKEVGGERGRRNTPGSRAFAA